MSNTIKWGISSGAWNTFTGSFQQAYGYVKNLDSSLNNIRIVSEKSADEMARFANQANKAAKSLGATTLDYTNASLIYYQQGLDEEQVANRTNTTVKLANTLGISAQEVSDYMTAIWNNFDDGSKSIEYYADVLTKLGAATASSAEEISTGLEKFAAISKTVGLSYEYATAALTTVTAETRQSAEVVGTAFKTLFARIQDLELGKTLEDGVTLGKYSEALKTIGISIVSSNGEMKKMDDILDELGKKWQTLTEAQKVSLAQTVAGTRQYTQLVALMDNWDDFSQNLNMAKNATGELNKQQAIYMESTEAHLDQLSAETERLYKNLIDSDGLNALVDAFSGLVAGVNQYTEAIGGSGSVLAQVGSIALRVMNKDLSKGITTSISNLIGLKDKAKEVNAQLELIQMFKGIPMNNGAYNQLLKMVDGLQKYRSVLTDTQIEEANAAIMRRNELANDLQAWDNAREKAELYFNVMTGENLDLSKSINSEDREKALASIDEFLVKYSQKTGQIKGLLDETFKSGQVSTDKEQRDVFIRRAEKLLQRNMLKNPETEKALKDGLKDYKEFVEQYPAVTQDILDKSGKVIGQYEFFDDNQEVVIEDFKKAYAAAVDEIIKDSGEVKTAIETSYAGLGTGISNAVEEADSS